MWLLQIFRFFRNRIGCPLERVVIGLNTREPPKEYKEAFYVQYEHKNGKMSGAQASLFDNPEVVLKWIWQNDNQDKTIVTFLLLENGIWIRGKPGIYQHCEEIWDKGKIKGEKITLKGTDEKIYQRFFKSSE